MTATATLIRGIKDRLRAQGLTYRELAVRLGVSEPTVKRDMARGNFTLQRLDRVCDVLGVGIAELIQPPATSQLQTELSENQEHALVTDPKLLVVTYLVVNDWKFDEIIETFQLDANELISILLKLDRLGVVDFRPPKRMRKLTARNFSWRRDGPVHEYFVRRVVPEFFSQFDTQGDTLWFVAGMLSPASRARFQASLGRVAAEFEQLAHHDARLPLADRDGCTAIVAFRSWEYSEFSKLRRIPRGRGAGAVQKK